MERYDGAGPGGPGRLPVLAAGGVRLVAAVHLPADEVVLALVEGPDADAVVAAMAGAGWPVHRVEPAILLHPWGDQT